MTPFWLDHAYDDRTHAERMAGRDRAEDHTPAGEVDARDFIEAVPARVRRRYAGDELAAQTALYGRRSVQAAPVAPPIPDGPGRSMPEAA